MMLRQLPRRYTYLAAITFCVLLYCSIQYNRQLPFQDYLSSHSKTSQITDIFDYAPLDSHDVRTVCEEKTWTPGLVFTCDRSFGGVGNVRNTILNCVRWAMQAGGGLVIPRIAARDPDDIAKLHTGKTVAMDFLFDTTHFTESLRLSCPQMQLFNSTADIPNYESTKEPLLLKPEKLDESTRTGIIHPAEWHDRFSAWLKENLGPERPNEDPLFSVAKPAVIAIARSYISWPIDHDGAGFASSFGEMMKFRPEARVLATSVINSLSKLSGFSVDDLPVYRNAYFGAHLRTEIDAVKGWPPGHWEYSRYDTQSRLYLEQVGRSNLSLIFVASGNTTEVARFAVDAATASKDHYRVLTKFDLLNIDETELLKSLAWDQQALVDYLVMLKSSDFGGVSHSSFAWNIALKRHLYSNVKDHLDGPQMLSDELSQIYGKPKKYPEYPSCLWP
jgi:GDP-fucose protein O-fucosyltransferase